MASGGDLTDGRETARSAHPRSERHLLTTLSLMVLIGVEVFAVAISGAWAIAGLFELGDYVGYGLMGLFSLVAVWLMLQLWQRATRSDLSR